MYIVIEILYSLFYRKLYRKFTLMAYKVFDCMIQTFFIYVKYICSNLKSLFMHHNANGKKLKKQQSLDMNMENALTIKIIRHLPTVRSSLCHWQWTKCWQDASATVKLIHEELLDLGDHFDDVGRGGAGDHHVKLFPVQVSMSKKNGWSIKKTTWISIQSSNWVLQQFCMRVF